MNYCWIVPMNYNSKSLNMFINIIHEVEKTHASPKLKIERREWRRARSATLEYLLKSGYSFVIRFFEWKQHIKSRKYHSNHCTINNVCSRWIISNQWAWVSLVINKNKAINIFFQKMSFLILAFMKFFLHYYF